MSGFDEMTHNSKYDMTNNIIICGKKEARIKQKKTPPQQDLGPAPVEYPVPHKVASIPYGSCSSNQSIPVCNQSAAAQYWPPLQPTPIYTTPLAVSNFQWGDPNEGSSMAQNSQPYSQPFDMATRQMHHNQPFGMGAGQMAHNGQPFAIGTGHIIMSHNSQPFAAGLGPMPLNSLTFDSGMGQIPHHVQPFDIGTGQMPNHNQPFAPDTGGMSHNSQPSGVGTEQIPHHNLPLAPGTEGMSHNSQPFGVGTGHIPHHNQHFAPDTVGMSHKSQPFGVRIGQISLPNQTSAPGTEPIPLHGQPFAIGLGQMANNGEPFGMATGQKSHNSQPCCANGNGHHPGPQNGQTAIENAHNNPYPNRYVQTSYLMPEKPTSVAGKNKPKETQNTLLRPEKNPALNNDISLSEVTNPTRPDTPVRDEKKSHLIDSKSFLGIATEKTQDFVNCPLQKITLASGKIIHSKSAGYLLNKQTKEHTFVTKNMPDTEARENKSNKKYVCKTIAQYGNKQRAYARNNSAPEPCNREATNSSKYKIPKKVQIETEKPIDKLNKAKINRSAIIEKLKSKLQKVEKEIRKRQIDLEIKNKLIKQELTLNTAKNKDPNDKTEKSKTMKNGEASKPSKHVDSQIHMLHPQSFSSNLVKKKIFCETETKDAEDKTLQNCSNKHVKSVVKVVNTFKNSDLNKSQDEKENYRSHKEKYYIIRKKDFKRSINNTKLKLEEENDNVANKCKIRCQNTQFHTKRDNLLVMFNNEEKYKEEQSHARKVKVQKRKTSSNDLITKNLQNPAKIRKIELIINVITEKTNEATDTLQNDSVSDLSFLDDINVDEIVEYLNTSDIQGATCESDIKTLDSSDACTATPSPASLTIDETMDVERYESPNGSNFNKTLTVDVQEEDRETSINNNEFETEEATTVPRVAEKLIPISVDDGIGSDDQQVFEHVKLQAPISSNELVLQDEAINVISVSGNCVINTKVYENTRSLVEHDDDSVDNKKDSPICGTAGNIEAAFEKTAIAAQPALPPVNVNKIDTCNEREPCKEAKPEVELEKSVIIIEEESPEVITITDDTLEVITINDDTEEVIVIEDELSEAIQEPTETISVVEEESTEPTIVKEENNNGSKTNAMVQLKSSQEFKEELQEQKIKEDLLSIAEVEPESHEFKEELQELAIKTQTFKEELQELKIKEKLLNIEVKHETSENMAATHRPESFLTEKSSTQDIGPVENKNFGGLSKEVKDVQGDISTDNEVAESEDSNVQIGNIYLSVKDLAAEINILDSLDEAKDSSKRSPKTRMTKYTKIISSKKYKIDIYDKSKERHKIPQKLEISKAGGSSATKGKKLVKVNKSFFTQKYIENMKKKAEASREHDLKTKAYLELMASWEEEIDLAQKLEERVSDYMNLDLLVVSVLHRGTFSILFNCIDPEGLHVTAKVTNIKKGLERTTVSGFEKETMLNKMQEGIPKEKLGFAYLITGLAVEGRWCLLMDYYPKNLEQALRESGKGFHINMILMLAKQLVSAVANLRNNGIVHSDIKPTHILLDAQNTTLKLCGFDESYHLDRAQKASNIGTIHYRAPEVILGHSVGHSIDVWATACVIHEMATNQKLFPGTSNNEVLYQHLSTLGAAPWSMVEQSAFKDAHYVGQKFLRRHFSAEDDGVKILREEITTFPKNETMMRNLLKAYVCNWTSGKTKAEKDDNVTKLHQIFTMLTQMLVLNPEKRISILNVNIL